MKNINLKLKKIIFVAGQKGEKMIKKILCKLGIHKYDYKNPEVVFLRNEGIKSFFKINVKCERCGKINTGIFNTPKI